MADALMLMVWNRSCKEVARIPPRSGVIRFTAVCESMVREAHCTSAYAASPSPQAMVAPPLKLTSSDTEYPVTNTGITPICHTNNSRAIRIQPLLWILGDYGVHQPRHRIHRPQRYNLGIRTQHQYDRNSHCRNKNTKHRTEPMARKALKFPATASDQRIATTLSAVTVINHSGEVDAKGSIIVSCLAREIVGHSANRRTIWMQHHAAPNALI